MTKRVALLITNEGKVYVPINYRKRKLSLNRENRKTY